MNGAQRRGRNQTVTPDPVRVDTATDSSGGEQTLRELVHEYKTKGPVYRRTVQTTLKASYTSHYRRGLIELLDVLEFRSNNTTHRPEVLHEGVPGDDHLCRLVRS